MALAYTTVNMILDRVPMIGSVSNLDSAQIVAIAERAEAEINASLAKNYALPLSGTSPLIEQIATGFSIYFILAQRIFAQERLQDSVWPERFKEDQAVLDKIRENKMILVDSAGTVITASAATAQVKSNTSGYDPTYWDGGSETEQITDPDKVDDGRAARNIGAS